MSLLHINPQRMKHDFDTLSAIRHTLPETLSEEEVHRRYIKAINKGILKVMSKMGISTYQSYCGAQIFDAVGLNSVFVEQYFTNTKTAIEGVGANRFVTHFQLRIQTWHHRMDDSVCSPTAVQHFVSHMKTA